MATYEVCYDTWQNGKHYEAGECFESDEDRSCCDWCKPAAAPKPKKRSTRLEDDS